MIKVPDAGSFAALRYLERVLGRKFGGSTGTNLYGAAQIMARMGAAGESGSVVILICDPGERYLDTYYDDGWLADNGFDIQPHLERLTRFHETGEWTVE
jgi:cysteine synthase A